MLIVGIGGALHFKTLYQLVKHSGTRDGLDLL